MLHIEHIRKNKESVIAALAKRGIDTAALIELVIDLDNQR